jgi:nucleoside-diphosphate-sugar epimerase
MIAKSLAVEIAGQADRVYRCDRDEPRLPAQWRFDEMHKGDVPATFASPDLLERLIAYKPSTGIDAGVMAFVEWYRGYYGI